MPLRVPPGRTGRLWLLRRIDAARRGGEVLEQKRQALLREELRLAEALVEAEREWEARVHTAAEWLRRAAVMAGERPLRLARRHSGARARVEVEWRNALGVVRPTEAHVALSPPDLSGLVGTAALDEAAAAHARAFESAARYAVLRAAHARIGADLGRTARRLRAIEDRWLPELEKALLARELSLDETEREEIMRIQWVIRRS